MQKITPFLWFDNRAEEAAKFYTSIFKESKVLGIDRWTDEAAAESGMPTGSVMTVEFQIEGQSFTALNGGPVFKFTPATSFTVACESEKEVDSIWERLIVGGSALMPLQKYDFSDKYGWVADKYGLSWQLFLGKRKTRIAPSLMFTGNQHGKAEEAIVFYTSIFKGSKVLQKERYGKGEGTQKDEGTLKFSLFTLDGSEFIAMDSGLEHGFTFTEAVSFLVNCKNQKEVDYYWETLTDGGKEVQCGWLKDKYGVSWQIVPEVLSKMLQDKDPQKGKRVMEAMLKMVKIDIKTLKQAYGQK